MANHSWVFLKMQMAPDAVDFFVRKAVERRLGDRLQIRRLSESEREGYWTDQRAVWWVSLPGSAKATVEEANRFMLAVGEDYGFTIWLNKGGKRLEFRHPLNMWESWAQPRDGCG